MQAYLGMYYVGTLATPSWLKFHIHLLSKTLVSKIDQKNGPLSMEPY